MLTSLILRDERTTRLEQDVEIRLGPVLLPGRSDLGLELFDDGSEILGTRIVANPEGPIEELDGLGVPSVHGIQG